MYAHSAKNTTQQTTDRLEENLKWVAGRSFVGHSLLRKVSDVPALAEGVGGGLVSEVDGDP